MEEVRLSNGPVWVNTVDPEMWSLDDNTEKHVGMLKEAADKVFGLDWRYRHEAKIQVYKEWGPATRTWVGFRFLLTYDSPKQTRNYACFIDNPDAVESIFRTIKKRVEHAYAFYEQGKYAI